jgi:hypothetical protein
LFGRLGGRGFDCNATNRLVLWSRGGRHHRFSGAFLDRSPRLFLRRRNDVLQLGEDDDAVIALLKASSDDLGIDGLALLGSLELGESDVEVAGKQNLQRCLLGMETDFALEGNRDSEDLARMRHTDISLELDCVIETALDKVRATERVVEDNNAPLLNVAFGDTDAFVAVPKLRQETGFNVALQIFGLHMDRPDKSTTFEERVTHTVCSY